MTPLSTKYWVSLPVLLAVSSVNVAKAAGGQSWDREVHWTYEPSGSLSPAPSPLSKSLLDLPASVPVCNSGGLGAEREVGQRSAEASELQGLCT